MMLRANSLLPCRGESKQKTKWEDMGAIVWQGGEMTKNKVWFLTKPFWADFLRPLLAFI